MAYIFNKLILSEKPTGHLLCRYYTADEKIGYFVISSDTQAKEKIKLASDLFIIGSSFLKISSVNLYDIGKFEPIFFIPSMNIENIVEGVINIEQEIERECFYVEQFKINKKTPILPTEAVYCQVRSNTFSVACECYPNPHSNPRLISMHIKFEDFFV